MLATIKQLVVLNHLLYTYKCTSKETTTFKMWQVSKQQQMEYESEQFSVIAAIITAVMVYRD